MSYLTIVVMAANPDGRGFEVRLGCQPMAHPSELAAAGIVSLVAVVAAVLAVTAWRAAVRTERRSLRFVAGAFAVLFAKQVIVSAALLTDFIHHQHLEVVAAAFDLVLVGLLIWPIVR